MTDQAPPGVGIRRCSPVFGPDGAGTVDEMDGRDIWCITSEGHYDAYTAEDLRLDLSDPTGLMHGVWALAEAMSLHEPTTATMQSTSAHTWTVTTSRPRGVFPASGPPMSSYNTRFTYEINDAIRRMMDRPGMAALWVVVPALADIPSDQPQQALAAIMRHVFGVQND